MYPVLRLIPVALLFAIPQVNAEDFSEQILGLDNDSPSMVASDGASQSIYDAPLATTVIDPEFLYLLGIHNYADAMWLVPGMNVSASGGSFPTISYHNTKYGQPRRQGIFVDNVSITRPSINNIEWNAIPLKFDTVETIEVQRGASTIEFGSQAFLSSVNIKSKDEQLTSKYSLELRGGSGDTSHASATISDSFNDHYYVSNIQYQELDIYDNREGEDIDTDTDTKCAIL